MIICCFFLLLQLMATKRHLSWRTTSHLKSLLKMNWRYSVLNTSPYSIGLGLLTNVKKMFKKLTHKSDVFNKHAGSLWRSRALTSPKRKKRWMTARFVFVIIPIRSLLWALTPRSPLCCCCCCCQWLCYGPNCLRSYRVVHNSIYANARVKLIRGRKKEILICLLSLVYITKITPERSKGIV